MGNRQCPPASVCVHTCLLLSINDAAWVQWHSFRLLPAPIGPTLCHSLWHRLSAFKAIFQTVWRIKLQLPKGPNGVFYRCTSIIMAGTFLPWYVSFDAETNFRTSETGFTLCDPIEKPLCFHRWWHCVLHGFLTYFPLILNLSLGTSLHSSILKERSAT